MINSFRQYSLNIRINSILIYVAFIVFFIAILYKESDKEIYIIYSQISTIEQNIIILGLVIAFCLAWFVSRSIIALMCQLILDTIDATHKTYIRRNK